MSQDNHKMMTMLKEMFDFDKQTWDQRADKSRKEELESTSIKAHKGSKNKNKGKILSEEHKRKISESNRLRFELKRAPEQAETHLESTISSKG